MASIGRALISVSDKTGVVEMARGLVSLGAEILSTGGTAKALRDAGLAVTDVAAYTGSPEILDGRVKTLHPKIHGGLLGRRSQPAHVAQMQQQGIGPIDVVVVNLYPFEATIAKPECSLEEAIENIDIGGPSMLRSAAKNHEDVLVVVDPADYQPVLEALRGETVSPAFRRQLAMKVFQHTARYDGAIASYLEKQVQDGEVKFPAVLSLQFERVETLRYGENPHQQGAFYRERGSQEASVSRGTILHGKAMSYNNYLDANSALELAKEFSDTAVAIIKHNNPCGVALGGRLRSQEIGRRTDCAGSRPRPPSRSQGATGADGQTTDSRRVCRLRLCMDCVQTCEVERNRLRPAGTDGWNRRGPDEPRRFREVGGDEGGPADQGMRDGLGRLLPVPRRARRGRPGRHHDRHPARGLHP